jgi:hypothetical protein
MNEAPSKQRTNLFLDSSSFPPSRFRSSDNHAVLPNDNRQSPHWPTNDFDSVRIRSYRRSRPSAIVNAYPVGSWVNCKDKRLSRDCDSDLSDSSDDEEGPVISHNNVQELRWSPNPWLYSKFLVRPTRRPWQKSHTMDSAATPPRRKQSAGNLTSLTR